MYTLYMHKGDKQSIYEDHASSDALIMLGTLLTTFGWRGYILDNMGNTLREFK